MRKAQIFLSIAAVSMACFLSMGTNKITVNAATVVEIPLESGKIIDEYDFDGDGKSDNLIIDEDDVCQEEPRKPWTIQLNEKTIYTGRGEYINHLSVMYYLVPGAPGYLAIQEDQDSNDDIVNHALYSFQDGNLVMEIDFYNPVLKHICYSHYGVSVTKITKQKVEVECRNQFTTTSGLRWKMIYKLKDGVWKLTGDTYKVTGGVLKNQGKKYWTLRKKKLVTYKKAGSTKKAITLKKGDKVKIKKICLKNKKTYMQVTTKSGKTGWFVSPKETKSWTGYFKEVMFAG